MRRLERQASVSASAPMAVLVQTKADCRASSQRAGRNCLVMKRSATRRSMLPSRARVRKVFRQAKNSLPPTDRDAPLSLELEQVYPLKGPRGSCGVLPSLSARPFPARGQPRKEAAEQVFLKDLVRCTRINSKEYECHRHDPEPLREKTGLQKTRLHRCLRASQ